MPKIFNPTDEQLGQKTIRINEDVWFEIQQNLLLQIVNTREGRDLLCIPQGYGKIFKIGKNHVFHSPRMENGKLLYDWDFRIGAKWANVIRYRWTEFQAMAQYFQSPFTLKPVVTVGVRMYAFGGPYYPDPNFETTTFDGWGRRTSTSWATVHDNATALTQNDEDTVGSPPECSLSGTTYIIRRPIFLFDTSAIPDTDVISAATFSLAADGTAEADANDDTADLVSSAPASNTAYTNTDYATLGTTLYATGFNVTSWNQTNNTYNAWTLNATGIAAISKTGVTKFGVRFGNDTANTAPAGQLNNLGGIYYADNADVTSDPKLTGTSAVASTFIPQVIMM